MKRLTFLLSLASLIALFGVYCVDAILEDVEENPRHDGPLAGVARTLASDTNR